MDDLDLSTKKIFDDAMMPILRNAGKVPVMAVHTCADLGDTYMHGCVLYPGHASPLFQYCYKETYLHIKAGASEPQEQFRTYLKRHFLSKTNAFYPYCKHEVLEPSGQFLQSIENLCTSMYNSDDAWFLVYDLGNTFRILGNACSVNCRFDSRNQMLTAFVHGIFLLFKTKPPLDGMNPFEGLGETHELFYEIPPYITEYFHNWLKE